MYAHPPQASCSLGWYLLPSSWSVSCIICYKCITYKYVFALTNLHTYMCIHIKMVYINICISICITKVPVFVLQMNFQRSVSSSPWSVPSRSAFSFASANISENFLIYKCLQIYLRKYIYTQARKYNTKPGSPYFSKMSKRTSVRCPELVAECSVGFLLQDWFQNVQTWNLSLAALAVLV